MKLSFTLSIFSKDLSKTEVFLHIVFFLLIVQLYPLYSHAQSTFDWVLNEGGYYNDEGLDIAVDGHGNSYVVGQIDQNAWFGSINTGKSTSFIAKYSSTGQLNWVEGITCQQSILRAVDLDSLGNVYVVGEIWDTAFVQSDTIVPVGGNDYLLAKFSTHGIVEWIISGGNSNKYSEDKLVDISIFDSKDIYVIGQGANDSIGFHISKYNIQGQLLWRRTGESPFGIYPTAISVDTDGDLYATGMFSSYIRFEDSTYFGYNGTSFCSFVIKFDSVGGVKWFKKASSKYFSRSSGIAAYDSGVFVVGANTGTWIKDSEIFIENYDEIGNLVWARSIGGSGHEEGVSVSYNEIENRIYVSGFSGSDTIEGGVNTNAIIYCIDQFGNVIWMFEEAGGKEIPTGYNNSINSTFISGSTLYFTGVFKDTINLWPWQLISRGHADVMIGKATLSNNFEITELLHNALVEVYPNPVSNHVFMRYTKKSARYLRVISLDGTLVKTIQTSPSVEFQIDLGDLPSGVYILTSEDLWGKELYTKKIIKL